MAGSSRTPKSRALGRALAEVRNTAGMTQRGLAGAINRGAGTVARWETGERMPTPDAVAQILTELGVRGERAEEILAMARGSNDAGWLAVKLPEQRAQMSALIDLESTATSIAIWNQLVIPSYLQTSDYIRAIMSAAKVPANEVGMRVSARIERRDVITRRDPAHLLALIGEAAFRQVIGTPRVMLDQLRYLLEMAEYPNIDVRVVPFSAGWHPGLEGPFLHIEPAAGRPVVHLENRVSGLMIDAEEDVSAYRDAIDTILDVAMSPDASSELIAKLITEWK
jgi:transcriptional regulator with XRE-family HTH domain